MDEEKVTPKKMGRPEAKIDRKQFENLCRIQCTYQEICDWFDVTDKTLNKWCRKEYGKTFSDVFRAKRGTGKISLRRTQWQMAETNPSMAIFLGKQYLGQSDRPVYQEEEKESDGLVEALKTAVSDIFKEGDDSHMLEKD